MAAHVVVNDDVDRAAREVAGILGVTLLLLTRALARRQRGRTPVHRPHPNGDHLPMPDRHPTMMEPPVEDLLDRVDSKFTLVSLAAMRGRQINSYFNQLGEGLGTIVPPQVTSVSRKPLSISLEEIAAGKITYVRIGAEGDVETVEAVEAVDEQPSEHQPAPEAGPAQAQAGGAAETREGPDVDDQADATDEVQVAATPAPVEVEREAETEPELEAGTEGPVGHGPEAEAEPEVTAASADLRARPGRSLR